MIINRGYFYFPYLLFIEIAARFIRRHAPCFALKGNTNLSDDYTCVTITSSLEHLNFILGDCHNG